MEAFLGVDWAEDHHDLCLLDPHGVVQATRRIPDGLEGVAMLHALVADHLDDASSVDSVVVGIATDHGLLATSLLAAGYQVYAVNPTSVAHYRDRHHLSRAKSDKSDAKRLAGLVRTERHNHRRAVPDSELLEAIKVLARGHQSLIWTRHRLTKQLRSALRDYFPGALEAFEDLHHRDALGPPGHGTHTDPGPATENRAIKAAFNRGG